MFNFNTATGMLAWPAEKLIEKSYDDCDEHFGKAMVEAIASGILDGINVGILATGYSLLAVLAVNGIKSKFTK